MITGADSGIGRAVAALFAREGADVAILYLCEHDDAAKTKDIVEKEGKRNGRRLIVGILDLSDQIDRGYQTKNHNVFSPVADMPVLAGIPFGLAIKPELR